MYFAARSCPSCGLARAYLAEFATAEHHRQGGYRTSTMDQASAGPSHRRGRFDETCRII